MERTITQKKTNTKYYLKRKQERKCVECGDSLPEGSQRIRCPKCLAIRNEKQKMDIKILKELKICIVCRTKYAEPFKTMCYECGLKDREQHKKWLAQQDKEELNRRRRIRSKEQYEYRKANGICTRCGKHKAMINHAMCERCNKKHNEYKRLKKEV